MAVGRTREGDRIGVENGRGMSVDEKEEGRRERRKVRNGGKS